MSMRIASRLRAVSTSVSPFDTLEPDAATFTVSADSRFSANSNETLRARGRLEEEIDDRRAAQRRHLLDRALADFLERLGGVENEFDLLAAERLEAEQILAEAVGVTPRVPLGDDDAVLSVELLHEHVDALRRPDA